MTWVKICGLRDLNTAQVAAAAGADAIGFVFARSPRQVSPDLARSIILRLPRSVEKVGVFVNEPLDYVQAVSEYCGLTMVQLHGEESPEYCSSLRWPVIKAIRVGPGFTQENLLGYQVDFFLLDSLVPGKVGGTGLSFDWGLLREMGDRNRIILAGGLTPENVSQAIRMVRPFGVDVSSGVETAGVKDPEKIQRFIAQVRASWVSYPM